MKKRYYIFNLIVSIILGISTGSFMILAIMTNNIIYGILTVISALVSAFAIACELDNIKNKDNSKED